MLTIYTKSGCLETGGIMKNLDEAEIEYAIVDISESDAARAYITSLGYTTVPVILAGQKHQQ